jgi:signal peptidase I
LKGYFLDKIQFLALKNRLKKDKVLTFNIASDSMSPLIKINDLITVKQTEHLKLFDIIVFYEFDHLTCHFVVNLKNSIQTSSFKNPESNDYPIKKEFYLGKVTNFKMGTFNKLYFLIKRFFSH